MISIIKTPCFPKEYTLSTNGKYPMDNGDFSLWFCTKEEAEDKAKEIAEHRKALNLFPL